MTSESGAAVETVPQSVARWRLPAGSHRLTAAWPGGTTDLEVNGRPGEVLFVELVGSVWVWDSSYRLERGEPANSRERATRLRLVADVG